MSIIKKGGNVPSDNYNHSPVSTIGNPVIKSSNQRFSPKHEKPFI